MDVHGQEQSRYTVWHIMWCLCEHTLTALSSCPPLSAHTVVWRRTRPTILAGWGAHDCREEIVASSVHTPCTPVHCHMTPLCEHVSPVHPEGQAQLLGATHVPPFSQLGLHIAGCGGGDVLSWIHTKLTTGIKCNVLTSVTVAPSPPHYTGALLRGHTCASIGTHWTAHS